MQCPHVRGTLMWSWHLISDNGVCSDSLDLPLLIVNIYTPTKLLSSCSDPKSEITDPVGRVGRDQPMTADV